MKEAKVRKILLMLIIENVHHSWWVSVTQGILSVPQSIQNKTLGVHRGILGLLFSPTCLLTTGMEMWIVFLCDHPCQFWRTRSVNVQTLLPHTEFTLRTTTVLKHFYIIKTVGITHWTLTQS